MLSKYPRASVVFLCLVLIGLCLRLVGLENPPLDHHHVRQADTSSIAELMRDTRISLLWPKIGWAGAEGGFVESEFPIYTALTAFGWRIWPHAGYIWPRILSIFMWGFGGVALYQWVKRHFSGPIWPFFILYTLSPLAIITSRNIQPDSMAVACLLWGLNTLDRSTTHTSLLLGTIIFGIGIAAKGQYFVLLPMVPFLLWNQPSSNRKHISHVCMASLVAFAIPIIWYLHAHFHLGSSGATFGVLGPDAKKWGSIELWTTLTTWQKLLQTLLMKTVTPLGLFLMLPVLCLKITRTIVPFELGFALCLMGWLILTEGHLIHNYYQLPLIPFASVIVGLGLRTLWTKQVRLLILIGVPLLIYSLIMGRRFILQATKIDAHIIMQASTLNTILPPNEPIVLISAHPQTILHASGRKGGIGNHYNPARKADYQEIGIKYIVIHQEFFTDDYMLERSKWIHHEDWLIQPIEKP